MSFDECRKCVKELYEKITEFRIIKGKLSNDPTLCEFDIEEKIIRVDSEKMDSPREFRKQYQKVMYMPAVRLKDPEWDELLFELIKKRKIIEAPEESENVFKAREIFAKICEFPVSDIEYEVTLGNVLYKYEGFYLFPSWKLKEIVDVNNFHIPFNTLSTAMTELGFKKPGTDNPYINKKRVRCWSFIPDKVNELKPPEKEVKS